jgi:hypothetical protein
MGTSLNGLTPAATYSGLLKTSDNASFAGTLKAITDGNGNESPLWLSDTDFSIPGSVNFSTADSVFYTKKLAVGGIGPFPGQLSFGDPTDGLIVTGSNITSKYDFSDYDGTVFEIAVGPNNHSRLKSPLFTIGFNSTQFSRALYFNNGFEINSNAVFGTFQIKHNTTKILDYDQNLGRTLFSLPISFDNTNTFKTLDVITGAGSATGDYLVVNINGTDYKLQLFAV